MGSRRLKKQYQKKTNGLGIASTIIGFLGIFLAFIPFCGIFTGITFGIFGGILGFVGFFAAISDKRTSIAFPLVGIAMCGLAIVFSFTFTGMFFNSVNDSIQDAKEQIEIEEKEIEQEAPVLGKNHIIGPFDDIIIHIVDYGVGYIDLNGSKDRSEELFWVKINIINKSETRIIEYSTWNLNDFSRHDVEARDSFGNNLERIGFFLSYPKDGNEREDIYPGEKIQDVLAFQTPVQNSDYILISLPRENVNGSGDSVVFKLPLDNLN